MAKGRSVSSTYSAQDIEVLEGLEPVRKRPGMYIAGTDTPAGLHQLVFEILDNSVDEAMNGHATEIVVTLHSDGESVTVTDNGRGIPVDLHPRYKKPALELILTTLHAGGKFSDKNYKTAGGLHGVGSSVVNALSEEMVAIVKRDGAEYEQRFSRGHVQGKLKTLRKGVKETGTSIFFRPDSEIFRSRRFSADTIRQAIKTKAYLNPGLELGFIDEAVSPMLERYCYKEGLSAYLKEFISEKKLQVVNPDPFILDKLDDVEVRLAFVWTESPSEYFLTYANGIFTPDGGSHELGAKAGIVRAVRNYFSVHDVQTKGLKIAAEDIREGLACIVSVKLPGGELQPQFQGQTKSKLNNPEVAPIVEGVAKNLERLLNEKPTLASAIVNRIMLAAKARAASRAAIDTVRRKIGVSHRLNLPGKLADCSSNKPEVCELFLVEGDSAGGSTKQGRDRHFQAVLPLRGKVLNTIAASNKRALENGELANIVSALGCGVLGECRPDRIRYGKVIILTDADADGMHIGTLLLAFFFQYFRPLLDSGKIFLGKSPLYGIYPKESKKKLGPFWAYSEAELEETIAREKLSSPRIVRFKGLGEMNPETLWETTLDPKRRTLLRVRATDAELASRALKDLMGSDPNYRAKLIHDNAELIELDL
jgi:DNA gyrase subunit B/topoisomerase-4 subunit B